MGIYMQADENSTVRGNTVQFVGGDFANTTGGADRYGIAIGVESWSMTPGTITSLNYTVSRNLVHDIIDERTFSAVGIGLQTTNGGSPTNNVVCSNIIYNVKSNGTAGDQAVGLAIAGGHSDQVVYNSIRMSGDVDPNAGATATSNFGSGIRIGLDNGTTHANLNLKNNVVYMDLFVQHSGCPVLCDKRKDRSLYVRDRWSGPQRLLYQPIEHRVCDRWLGNSIRYCSYEPVPYSRELADGIHRTSGCELDPSRPGVHFGHGPAYQCGRNGREQRGYGRRCDLLDRLRQRST
ncbi:MAG: hypothetical protein IPI41_10370 [Flavobacteriales bacterium]|nr:hypothetical protein [Flavobacteriales bacterium]